MRSIEGYDVKIFTDNVEKIAIEQIKQLLSIDVSAVARFALCPMFMPVPDA